MTFLELFRADVRIERDIDYGGPGGTDRHRLDIYAPPRADGLPVVVYFYGGGWHSGDKRLFEHLGRAFAIRGSIAVTVNYRLTPQVTHPAHVEDCARAVAWVHRSIVAFGGDPDRIVLCGHSAGGHLAALLAMDDRFLDGAEVPRRVIRGVVMISAASDLREHDSTGGFTSMEMLHAAFGPTAADLWQASPARLVRRGLPPFLIIVAENDPEGLQRQGRTLAENLRQADVDVYYIRVLGRDHFSIVRRFGPSDDTTANAIADFIEHVADGA